MTISDTNERDFIIPDGPYVIDFHAEWCAPCRAVAPILEKLSADFPDVPVFRVDADANQALVLSYGVSGLPTVVFHDSQGHTYKSVSGAKPKSLYRDLFEAVSGPETH